MVAQLLLLFLACFSVLAVACSGRGTVEFHCCTGMGMSMFEVKEGAEPVCDIGENYVCWHMCIVFTCCARVLYVVHAWCRSSGVAA
jgi:hypothetical protein